MAPFLRPPSSRVVAVLRSLLPACIHTRLLPGLHTCHRIPARLRLHPRPLPRLDSLPPTRQPFFSIPAAVVHAQDLRPHSVPVPASVDARASVYVPRWIATTRALLYDCPSSPLSLRHPTRSTDVRLCARRMYAAYTWHLRPRLHLSVPSSTYACPPSPPCVPSRPITSPPVVATAAPVFDGPAEDSLPIPATPPPSGPILNALRYACPRVDGSSPQLRLRRPVSIRPLPSSPHARLHLPLTDPPQVKATRARVPPRASTSPLPLNSPAVARRPRHSRALLSLFLEGHGLVAQPLPARYSAFCKFAMTNVRSCSRTILKYIADVIIDITSRLLFHNAGLSSNNTRNANRFQVGSRLVQLYVLLSSLQLA
ncbi:hypothetical protein C8R44DRAFT_891441 [Mycena epipterygia]|nr:hypothetical protein C8R44DRAFT_891441 [Mycena epipterygia]